MRRDCIDPLCISHARMNAVRLRKENQVLSAEEKRLELIANEEARKMKQANLFLTIVLFREASLIADLKTMLKLKNKSV